MYNNKKISVKNCRKFYFLIAHLLRDANLKFSKKYDPVYCSHTKNVFLYRVLAKTNFNEKF